MQARRERLSEALAAVTAVEVRQIYSVEVASGASTLNGHGWTCSHVTAGAIVFVSKLLDRKCRETSTNHGVKRKSLS